MNKEQIHKEYPLHFLVWNNHYQDLDRLLATERSLNKEIRDVRGRTPLMLAVTLGHLESTRVLLRHGVDVNATNKAGWTAVQEAVATGDPELVRVVLEHRDFQRSSYRAAGIPELLNKLKEAPDFYVEMKWEFTSWVPLVSRMCPSDTYKVYKQGSSVRIDTTLLGFDQTNWQRGNRTYVFRMEHNNPFMMEVDHDTQQVFMEQMKIVSQDNLSFLNISDNMISQRLTSPLVTTYLDTEKISFERNKSGIWGWRSDKMETVNGYECKVFSATNVELITKTRMEHLTDPEKEKVKEPRNPLQSFLGVAETQEKEVVAEVNGECSYSAGNPCHITPEEYFDGDVDLQGRDIGRPKETSSKVQKFRATLWLSENYPLSLPEQVMPIVDLMAISSTHFKKLKNFIEMQLPSGFPVKIEIPLFHVLNACITFGNIFGTEEEIQGVTRIEEDDRLMCVVDDSVFYPPPGYQKLDLRRHRYVRMDEDDELMQYAIQQSMLDAGGEREQVDIWEALQAQRPSRPDTPGFHSEEERQLQRAIEASLMVSHSPDANSQPSQEEATIVVTPPTADNDLELVLALSRQEEEEERERRQREEEELNRVLELSLTEK